MFVLYAEKNRLSVRQRETMTSGSVNVYCVRFDFAADWDGLTRTAVFQAGAESRSILLDESGACGIPWEVLTAPNVQLRAGVYGTLGGEVVLPTVWARLGTIFEGVSPGPDAAPPTPDRWQQELDKKQDKLHGLPGQVVGFDADGNAVAQEDTGGSGGGGGEGKPGPPGPPGMDGKSAYQIAVDEGFEGTEAEWLASLVGPQGPDGNPVGTIISFMGSTTPDGYLVCDGAEYPVVDYPALTGLFRAQFGAVNYFGGDGTATFAVPDMRNLFLRGYHGEAEEQLSADIGEKQEATEHLNVNVSNSRKGIYSVASSDEVESPGFYHEDSVASHGDGNTIANGTFLQRSYKLVKHYTSRPVNMAVLYCIKATESIPGGENGSAFHIYSTEEHVVGMWIDGRDVCEKTYIFTIPSGSNSTSTWDILDASLSSNVVDFIVSYSGSYHINNEVGCIPYTSGSASRVFFISFVDGLKYNCSTNWKNARINVTIQYVKKVTEV